MTDNDDGVFDAPALMRLAVVDHLGLRGEERVAGLVTGAGYPEALVPIVGALADVSGAVLDVGAGLGGAAAFTGREAGVAVVGVEPEVRVAGQAGAAFPDVTMVAATATRLPAASGTVAAVTMLGAVSLIEDLDAALAEATRVVERRGRIGITDLCLADGDDELRSGPNVFRSVSLVVASLTAHGWVEIDVMRRPADAPTSWDDTVERVDDAVEARYGETDAGRAWREDRQRLRDLIGDGALIVATITATRAHAS